jgi:hypothetical protein
MSGRSQDELRQIGRHSDWPPLCLYGLPRLLPRLQPCFPCSAPPVSVVSPFSPSRWARAACVRRRIELFGSLGVGQLVRQHLGYHERRVGHLGNVELVRLDAVGPRVPGLSGRDLQPLSRGDGLSGSGRGVRHLRGWCVHPRSERLHLHERSMELRGQLRRERELSEPRGRDVFRPAMHCALLGGS